MRKHVRVVVAAIAALSGIAIAGVALAEKPNNCDGCLVGVALDGTLLGSRGVVSSRRVRTGVYEVTFRRTIAGCAITANQVLFDNLPMPPEAYVSVGVVSSNPKVLRFTVIWPNNGGLGFIDSSFNASLVCL